MTISLARRQKLAAIAKAHDEWVNEHLASVSSEFDPAAYPKPGSDYNQHNLDVDASGEAEDELAAKVEAVFGGPMTAAGDPDWDPKEHPRGPDGKFIETADSEIDFKIKKMQDAIAVTSLTKNIAYMKGEDYKVSTLNETLKEQQEQLEKLEAEKKSSSTVPKSPALVTPSLPAFSPTPTAKGGQPITAWTKTIYSGKYEDGQVVAVHADGGKRLVWDEGGKKYVLQTQKHKGVSSWKSDANYTKKGAYAAFKGSKKDWLTPAPGAMAIHDAPPPPMFDHWPSGESQPLTTTPSAQTAITSGDFSSLKQVGAQAGSTSGGFFEAPDGSRWYVKSQKSEKHAKNEALAAALYNAAGIEVPVVIRGKGAPGLSGQNHTATRVIEGATPNLKQKLNDPDYLAKIREGFVVDAWLANWDTVGLVFDNVVEDADGNPKRIDVGGSLVFRAMGDEKGALFGPTVGELTTLRDPHMAPTASKVFAGISDGELAYSASKIAAITPFQIRELVKDYGMDESVADILIDRRQDILSKITPSATNPSDPVPVAAQPAPVISKESTGKTTKWTKGKFNTTIANKTSYENREIVGIANLDGLPTRILWENGKFRAYNHHFDKGWQYTSTWTSKKDALAALKGVDFYRPPKGTMAMLNNDYIPWNMLVQGDASITVNDSTEPDLLTSLMDSVPTSTGLVPDTFGKINTKPWDASGKPFMDYKTSMKVYANNVHIGAIHEQSDGVWITALSWASGRGQHLPQKNFPTKVDALKAIQAANDAYEADKVSNASPVKTPDKNPTTKKVAKLTAAQIEKQNGNIPKTLTHAQRGVFNKNFKFHSPIGTINSLHPDPQEVFTALAYAVSEHNKTQSPKLNFLQGIKVFDETYGSQQKANIIAWLQTSEGKALAPLIVETLQDVGKPLSIVTPVGVPSAYDIGKPQKVHPTEFRTFSLSDALEMHAEMYADKPLNGNEISTIRDYMGSSDDFNEPLRGESSLSGWKLNQIQTLQGAMRPTTRSLTVIRGTDGLGAAINTDTIKNLEDLKKFEGAVVGDPAFLSTSIDPAGAFSGKNFKLIINVPKGTPASFLYAEGGGLFENEKEMLLAAGLHYKIDHVEQNLGRYVLYMTVVPKVVVKK